MTVLNIRKMSHNLSQMTVDEVIDAWTMQVDQKVAQNPEGAQFGFQLLDHALKLLTQGQPVSAERLAANADLPLEEVQAAYEQMQAQGGEFDENGNLTGAALTLIPTPHRFRVNGRLLYTWCSLDAMFLPGLLGETAVVESTCPSSGETIHLTITPDGVTDYSPTTTVLSIAVPGLTCETENISCSPDKKGGSQREGCNQMNFFRDRAAAEAWIEDYPGVAILAVAEAWQLAKTNWIDRHQGQTIINPDRRDIVDSNHQVGCCC